MRLLQKVEAARKQFESKLGHSVISPAKATDYLSLNDGDKDAES